MLEDLLTIGEGLDIVEHEVGAGEAGRRGRPAPTTGMLLAVVRDGELIHFDDERARSFARATASSSCAAAPRTPPPSAEPALSD